VACSEAALRSIVRELHRGELPYNVRKV